MVLPGEDGDDSLWKVRVEIDTSAPFLSVKEAVDHFGGKGHWKLELEERKQLCSVKTVEGWSIAVEEEPGAELENDLTCKKSDTLEVLKELEMSKTFLEGLNLDLHDETSGDVSGIGHVREIENKVKTGNVVAQETRLIHLSDSVLIELNRAKSTLARMGYDLACTRLSIERMNDREFNKEEISQEEIYQRLALNSTKVISLEKELDQTKLMLQLIKDADASSVENSPDKIPSPFELSYDREQFNQLARDTENEALKLTGEIERAKSGIMSAVIRLHPVADQIEKPANSTESAIVQITPQLNSHRGNQNSSHSVEDLSFHAPPTMDDDKTEEETSADTGEDKETNNTTAGEEAIYKWLLENDQEGLLDSGIDLHDHDKNPETSPVLSIGQILKRKLMGTPEFQLWNQGCLLTDDPVTLGQLMSKRHVFSLGRFHMKRRRFGFVGDFPSILAKHHKKKRRQA